MKTTKKYGKKKDLALSTWVKLARAYATVNKKADRSIRKFNVTQTQFGVIECLGHLGEMPIGTLCNKMLTSGGNMTYVLDNLEKDGLIERLLSPEDRRTYIVKLSKKGDEMFQNIFIHHAEHIEEVFSVLTEQEQKTLSELLKKLGTSLQKK